MARPKKSAEAVEIGGEVPTNGAEALIAEGEPYVAQVVIEGVVDILFHRWNCEAVEEKAKAAKGSAAKKSDDIQSYVYRTEDGQLAIPGEYLRRAIVEAARFRQDPRSPRKSAMDLFNAGVASLTLYATLGSERWDYEDKRRVRVQRNSITRSRPAFKAGWQATFDLMVTLPEYIPPPVLNEVITNAGRFIGIADGRPSYGRFVLVGFDVREPTAGYAAAAE